MPQPRFPYGVEHRKTIFYWTKWGACLRISMDAWCPGRSNRASKPASHRSSEKWTGTSKICFWSTTRTPSSWIMDCRIARPYFHGPELNFIATASISGVFRVFRLFRFMKTNFSPKLFPPREWRWLGRPGGFLACTIIWHEKWGRSEGPPLGNLCWRSARTIVWVEGHLTNFVLMNFWGNDFLNIYKDSSCCY